MEITMPTTDQRPEESLAQKSLNSQESKQRSSVGRWFHKAKDATLLKTLRRHADSSSTERTSTDPSVADSSVETVGVAERLGKTTSMHPARTDSLMGEEASIAKIDDNSHLKTPASISEPEMGTSIMPPPSVARSQTEEQGKEVIITQDIMRMIMESNKKRAIDSIRYQGVKKRSGATVISHTRVQDTARGMGAPANPLRWSQD
ncbi:hypothetical protein GMOD_00001995 [Pyrenophora seminiperda CCB06]|uniref:Uncharacterized protein n=1 Tax=Pyrenophora seminiperda CCB06 TaxID=1302712 RepID=A0A3M7LWS4_9PLEO|nr:hypothetical protein GMOD_00001995 [Pyrenophora seminiperda CCB06]